MVSNSCVIIVKECPLKHLRHSLRPVKSLASAGKQEVFWRVVVSLKGAAPFFLFNSTLHRNTEYEVKQRRCAMFLRVNAFYAHLLVPLHLEMSRAREVMQKGT